MKKRDKQNDSLKKERFSTDCYVEPLAADLASAARGHASTRAFLTDFDLAFDGFADMLERDLLDNRAELDPAAEKERLAADIFARLEAVPQVDRYAAYQLLHDGWERIAGDLEIIRSEGESAVTRVDPRMVVKKRGGADVEEQDGWEGRIIPFALAQEALLGDELAALRKMEDALAQTSADIASLLEELRDDEDAGAYLNEDRDAFDLPAVKAALREKAAEAALLRKLREAQELAAREKAQKKTLREARADLHFKTKAVVEALTPEEARDLLRRKWIAPLADALARLPEEAIEELVAALEALAAKYSATLAGVEADIAAAQGELRGMLGELTGNEWDMRGLAELQKLLGGDTITAFTQTMLDKLFPSPDSDEPEIRFKGFTGKWERVSLGAVGKATSGVGFPEYVQGGSVGIPFFKVSDMNLPGNEKEMNIANNYVTEEQIVKYGWHPVTKIPAIFFAKVGAAVMLNRKRIIRTPFLCDNNTMSYSFFKETMDDEFCKYLFDSIDLTSLVQVGALPSYNAKDVEEIVVSIPMLEEQIKIGRFLCGLESLINVYNKKLVLLKTFKQACLARMFV